MIQKPSTQNCLLLLGKEIKDATFCVFEDTLTTKFSDFLRNWKMKPEMKCEPMYGA